MEYVITYTKITGNAGLQEKRGMNIEILQDYVDTFTREIVESGFKRDLDDYITSLPNSQNNIVTLREIAEKVLLTLEDLYSGDLPDSLGALLPVESNRPFTEVSHQIALKELVDDTEIQQADFFNKLTQFLNQLKKQIQNNENKINEIKGFIAPYLSADLAIRTDLEKAVLSIVFKEHQTISSLNNFSKTLVSWNKVLPIYHQLLVSESPEDIEIIEVQNGSIDIVLNLNVDVALNLVEVFKLGFEVFGAYLTYKKIAKPIVDSYYGNEKLITQEDQREKLLLDNIGDAIQRKVMSQHEEAKELDEHLDGTAIKKKVAQITELVASHIIKGNDIKLLSLPEMEDQEDQEDLVDEGEALRLQSMKVRHQHRLITDEAQQKLLEMYGAVDDE